MAALRTVLLDGDPHAPHQARLGAALAERGLNVVILDAPDVAARIRQEFGQTCAVLQGPKRRTGPLAWMRLLTAVRRLDVDVVHLNYLRPGQRVWRWPGAPPYVATAWGSDLNEQDFPRSAWYGQKVDGILAGAAAISADSVPLLEAARRRAGGRSGQPAELILWGVDTDRFQRQTHQEAAAAMRAELHIQAEDMVLLSPRQTAPHYRVDDIVKAFAASTWAERGVLVIKLHDKPDEQRQVAELQALAETLGVGEKIRFSPRCAYHLLPAVYAMADVAVSAVRVDGVPSTFCELMALQVPVLAVDLPAYDGVLEADRGRRVAAGDVPAMSAALDELAGDDALRAQLGQAGRRWAVAHSDWRRCVDRWVGLYEGAL